MVGSVASACAQAPTTATWVDSSPHRTRTIPVAQGVRLEVLDWGGTGPALVFLTGLGDNAHVYDDFAPRFRDRFHVYAITRRGFGASSEPPGPYDAATRARDIVTVLDTLGVAHAVLAGHSIAGDELSMVGATYPGRVRALVYLEAYDYGMARTDALGANPPPMGLYPPMTRADSASPAAVAAYVGRTFMNGAPVPEAAVRAQWVFGRDGRLFAAGPGLYAGPKVIGGTEPSAFARITAPALGVFATYPGGPAEMFRTLGYAHVDSAARVRADQFFAGRIAWATAGRDRFRAALPHGTVVELPGASHYVFLSNPDEVERAMRTFLSQTR